MRTPALVGVLLFLKECNDLACFVWHNSAH